MFDVVFFSGTAFLSALFLFAAFSFKRRKGSLSAFLSAGFLVLASLAVSAGVLEGVLIFSEKQIASAKNITPPQFLKDFNANPHWLIQDSILYIAPPNGKFRTFGHKFSTNRLGFRERDFPFDKPDDTFRILVFGDSLTFGVAIDNDHRYTNVLEDLYNLAGRKKKIEVLNFGMGGYSTDQEHDLMKAVLKRVKCDLVIVGFCENDLQITSQSILKNHTRFGGVQYDFMLDGVEFFNNPERTVDHIPETQPSFLPPSPWFKKTRIYNFLEMRTNINIDGALPPPDLWQYAQNEFLGMKETTRKYNLPPPVVILLYTGSVDPNKNNFKRPAGQFAQNIQLMKFAGENLRKKGFPIVDPLPRFEKYSGMSMAVSEWDRHPNYLAHYIYAESLAQFLLTNVFVLQNP